MTSMPTAEELRNAISTIARAAGIDHGAASQLVERAVALALRRELRRHRLMHLPQRPARERPRP